MATQTIQLNRPNRVLNGNLLFDSRTNPISADLVSTGVGAFLIGFSLRTNGRISLQIGATASASTGTAGPDLTELWETNPNGLVITRSRANAGSISITVGGPDAGGTVDDDSDPYSWTPSNSAEIATLVAGHVQRTDTYQLTFSDEHPITTVTPTAATWSFLAANPAVFRIHRFPRGGSEGGHPFSIDAGSQSGWTGYWFNNAGTLNDGAFQTPDGRAAIVRQLMVQNGTTTLRFAASIPNLAIDQFPPTIVTGDITWDRPATTFQVGQGTAATYTTQDTHLVASTFTSGETIRARLGYPGGAVAGVPVTPATWSFSASRPRIEVTSPEVTVTPTPAAWSFTAARPLIRRMHKAEPTPATWSFAASTPTIEVEEPVFVTVTPTASTWSFAAANPTIRRYRILAVPAPSPATWSFAVSQATYRIGERARQPGTGIPLLPVIIQTTRKRNDRALVQLRDNQTFRQLGILQNPIEVNYEFRHRESARATVELVVNDEFRVSDLWESIRSGAVLHIHRDELDAPSEDWIGPIQSVDIISDAGRRTFNSAAAINHVITVGMSDPTCPEGRVVGHAIDEDLIRTFGVREIGNTGNGYTAKDDLTSRTQAQAYAEALLTEYTSVVPFEGRFDPITEEPETRIVIHAQDAWGWPAARIVDTEGVTSVSLNAPTATEGLSNLLARELIRPRRRARRGPLNLLVDEEQAFGPSIPFNTRWEPLGEIVKHACSFAGIGVIYTWNAEDSTITLGFTRGRNRLEEGLNIRSAEVGDRILVAPDKQVTTMPTVNRTGVDVLGKRVKLRPGEQTSVSLDYGKIFTTTSDVLSDVVSSLQDRA